MTGRALAVVAELGADLQPAGWRLTDAAGIDLRRARSLLSQDLDAVEERTQDRIGVFKTQLTGPWTLAATVEKPRGDRVLSDHGARRELAQALAEGVRDPCRGPAPPASRGHGAPGPGRRAGPAGRAGRLDPHRVRFRSAPHIHPPEASEALGWVFDAISEAGAVPIAHCCASDVPVALLRGAGARGLSVDLAAVGTATYDGLAGALDAGERVLLGVVPPFSPTRRRPTVPSASRCSAGSTCSASSRPTTCCSPPPVAWPERHRPGRGRRWSSSKAARHLS